MHLKQQEFILRPRFYFFFKLKSEMVHINPEALASVKPLKEILGCANEVRIVQGVLSKAVAFFPPSGEKRVIFHFRIMAYLFKARKCITNCRRKQDNFYRLEKEGKAHTNSKS